MVLRPADKERGLAAFNEARQTRRRAIVFGRVRVREVATRFWICTFIGIGVFSVGYYHYVESKLVSQKAAVMAQQRAIALGMGTSAAVLAGKLEAWVMAFASVQPPPDRVAAGASLDAISRGPGIYLRLPLAEAGSVETIRRAASRSLHDAFTSCLFVGRAGDPQQGTACKSTSQCGPGELCNDWSVCAVPSQPFNARILYEALRVVEPEWARGLEAAQNDLEVRAVELDLQDAGKHEVVAAAELARRSKYFTLVLDEPASAALEPAPAGIEESADERLQAVDHFVRVGIWDIERGEALLSMRVETRGRFLAVGSHLVASGQVQRAQQRQANNCAAATEVRDALTALPPGSEASDAPDLPGAPELPKPAVADE